MITTLNALLATMESKELFFVFLTGASGAGKTFLAHALEDTLDPCYAQIAYFDRIGVPSVEIMVRDYGSGEKWQEAMTYAWIEKLSKEKDKKLIVLEGQYNPHFAVNACAHYGIKHYLLVLVHAHQEVRERRLREQRHQPELANETMNSWAEFLKRTTQELQGVIIDTSDSGTTSHIARLEACIKDHIG